MHRVGADGSFFFENTHKSCVFFSYEEQNGVYDAGEASCAPMDACAMSMAVRCFSHLYCNCNANQ